MKAEELMIVDWVTARKWIENPFKITKFDDKFVYGKTAGGSVVGPFLLEEIIPIPLTQEILEKLGFVEKEYWFELVVGEYRILCDMKQVAIIHGDHTDLDVPICYFHELQHALKICGVKKEIIL